MDRQNVGMESVLVLLSHTLLSAHSGREEITELRGCSSFYCNCQTNLAIKFYSACINKQETRNTEQVESRGIFSVKIYREKEFLKNSNFLVTDIAITSLIRILLIWNVQ